MDVNITNPVTASKIGEVVNASASATPNDTDLVMSVDTSVAKKNTWTQIKAFLKTYFDTIYTTTSLVANQISTALATFKTDNYLDATSSIQTQLNKKKITLLGGFTSLAPADSTSYYFLPTNHTPFSSNFEVMVFVNPFNVDLIITDFSIKYSASVVGSGESTPIYLEVTNVTSTSYTSQTLVATLTTLTAIVFNNIVTNGLSITVPPNYGVRLRLDAPVYVTNPSNIRANVIINATT